MRITRVYYSDSLATGSNLTLSKDSSHYLANVLRLKPGDQVALFNAECGEFQAVITAARKGSVDVTVAEQRRTPVSNDVHIELGLGLSKGDRMDYGIQKSVELGVTAITPLNCEFGEVRFKQAARVENKLRHWRRIAVSAAEQSGRLDVPAVNPPMNLFDWLEALDTETRLCLDPGADVRLGEHPLSRSLALLIGPEGGFSEGELSAAQQQQFALASLGPRVLRTETAPVAALAVIQHCLNN